MTKNDFIKVSALLGLLIISCTSYSQIKSNKLVDGLTSPWAMALLPNGDILVTERAGKIRIVRDGKLLKQEISGVPPVYEAGQGGLLDIKLDRKFNRNQTIYLSYAHGTRKKNAVRLAKAKLTDNALVDLTVLFTGNLRSTAHHYGARIAQLKDNTLLMSVGDGYNYREDAQRLNTTLGKIIRVDQNGNAPTDNPYVKIDGALPEIYSTGHRNPQGLVVIDSNENGESIIAHEHGARGGDEINLIHARKNYGWPVITLGIDYNGARISPFTEYEGMEQPGVDWTPSIAPSGMTFYSNAKYPKWNDSLFVTSLSEQSIRRITFTDNKFTDHGVVLSELGKQRYRDIITGPNGALYVMTDGSPAHIFRVLPTP